MTALCVFAKEPAPGAVKTRLARLLGDETAALLARAFLLDTIDRLRAFPGDLWVAYSPADAEEAFQELFEETTDDRRPRTGQAPGSELQAPSEREPGARSLEPGAGSAATASPFLMPQDDGDLGQRIEQAVLRLQARSYERVILLGADSPTLPWPSLLALAEALATHPFALGPADDGGFWGLGARQWQAGLLDSVPWSSAETCALTRQRLETIGPVALAPSWYDVDEPDDLRRLRDDPALPYCPHTHRLIHSRWVAPFL